MEKPPSPSEVESLDILPLHVMAQLVRTWRNHWAEAQRITSDFPEDIKRVLALRPTDPTEALEQTVAQFAVLFNPEATAGFVTYLDAALRSIETAMERSEVSSAPR